MRKAEYGRGNDAGAPTSPTRNGSECARAACQEQWLTDVFGEIRRDKPRSKPEADFLRRVGTPERLIGPVIEDEPQD